jgi:hypothetical protein
MLGNNKLESLASFSYLDKYGYPAITHIPDGLTDVQ